MVLYMILMFLMSMYLIWILIFVIQFGLTVFLVMNLRYSSNSSALSYRSFLNISLILFVLIIVFLISLIISQMKEKSNVNDVSSVSTLFASPLPYDSRQPRKTILVIPAKDEKGANFALTACVEDSMKDILQLDFQDQLLSTLIDKGVDPKTLNMIDVSKLGCDAGVEQLANHIMSHVDDYVVKPQSDVEK